MVRAVGHWRRWAGLINRDALAICLAMRDARVPWYAKLLAVLAAGYALTPFDLVPDFALVLGLVDDLVLVPLGLLAVVRLIPVPLMAELRADAARLIARHGPKFRWGAAIVIGVWLALAAAFAWWLGGLLFG